MMMKGINPRMLLGGMLLCCMLLGQVTSNPSEAEFSGQSDSHLRELMAMSGGDESGAGMEEEADVKYQPDLSPEESGEGMEDENDKEDLSRRTPRRREFAFTTLADGDDAEEGSGPDTPDSSDTETEEGSDSESPTPSPTISPGLPSGLVVSTPRGNAYQIDFSRSDTVLPESVTGVFEFNYECEADVTCTVTYRTCLDGVLDDVNPPVCSTITSGSIDAPYTFFADQTGTWVTYLTVDLGATNDIISIKFTIPPVIDLGTSCTTLTDCTESLFPVCSSGLCVDCESADGTSVNSCEDQSDKCSWRVENSGKCSKASDPCTLPVVDWGANFWDVQASECAGPGKFLPSGNNCQVSCIDGYSSRVARGDTNSYKCDGSGIFSVPSFPCVQNCALPTISSPFETDCESTLEAGESCTVTCQDGFTPRSLQDSTRYRCDLAGALIVPDLECLASCPIVYPLNMKPGEQNPCLGDSSNLPAGESCRMQCKSGFFPTAGSLGFRCGDDSILQEPTAMCFPACTLPDALGVNVMFVNDANSGGENLDLFEDARVKCKQDFQPDSGTLKYTCGTDGLIDATLKCSEKSVNFAVKYDTSDNACASFIASETRRAEVVSNFKASLQLNLNTEFTLAQTQFICGSVTLDSEVIPAAGDVSDLLVQLTETQEEIADGTGNAICAGENGLCPDGTLESDVTNIATDIDECTEGTDRCLADATCTNVYTVPGSEGYICTCNDGFQGDGFNDCFPDCILPSSFGTGLIGGATGTPCVPNANLPSQTSCDIACDVGYAEATDVLYCTFGVLSTGSLVCAPLPCVLPAEVARDDVYSLTGCDTQLASGSFNDGDICTLSCLAGYGQAEVNTDFTCDKGITTYEPCEELPCELPVLTGLDTSSCGSTLGSGETCAAVCADGYFGDETTLECSRGVLVSPSTNCAPRFCQLPAELKDNMVGIPHNGFPACVPGSYLASGSSCGVQCDSTSSFGFLENTYDCNLGVLTPPTDECVLVQWTVGPWQGDCGSCNDNENRDVMCSSFATPIVSLENNICVNLELKPSDTKPCCDCDNHSCSAGAKKSDSSTIVGDNDFSCCDGCFDDPDFSNGFGDCSSYERGSAVDNFQYCATDNTVSGVHTNCCAACEQQSCDLHMCSSGTNKPNAASLIGDDDFTCCDGCFDDPNFSNGFGDCSSYERGSAADNFQYCATDNTVSGVHTNCCAACEQQSCDLHMCSSGTNKPNAASLIGDDDFTCCDGTN